MAQQSSMTKSSRVSRSVAIVGWILLSFAILLFFEANKPGADVAYMGPSAQDILIPFAQLVLWLAGFMLLIAFITGLVDYLRARKRKRVNRKMAWPSGLILSGVGLAVVVGLTAYVFTVFTR